MFRYSKRYFYYLRRTGLFRFLADNLLKLAVLLSAFYAVLWFMETLGATLRGVFSIIIENTSAWTVFLLFAFSESFLGILPPDLFIIWAKEWSEDMQANPWLLVVFLATLSYFGGWVSYGIGTRIYKIPRLHTRVQEKYSKLLNDLKKWGGFFVVTSALLPVPFSIVMMVCGITGYPFKWAAYLSLFRYLRFFVYAYFLFKII